MKKKADRLYQEGTFVLADGDLVRGKKILDKLLAIAPDSPMAIELSGDFAKTSGDLDEALEWYEQLVSKNFGDEWCGVGYMGLAATYQAQRELEKAVDAYRKALAPFRAIGEFDRLWIIKHLIGEILIEMGMFQQAVEVLEEAFQEIRNHPKRQRYLDFSLEIRTSLAESYRMLGRLDDSTAQWEKIAHLAKKYDNPALHASALDGLGVVCQIQGRFEEAKEYHTESLHINRNIRYLEGQSVTLGNLARLHIQMEQWDQAEQYIRKSIKIEQKNENLIGIAFDKLILAEIDIGRLNYEAAEKKLLQLESLMSREGYGDDMIAISSQLGYVHRMMGRLDEAFERQLIVLDRARKMNHGDGIPAVLDELAEIELARGNREQAKGYWQEALELYERLGSERMIESIRMSLADLDSF
ncbi:MAG: tetratricopeptide repeat protein [Planctomycetota bacterium]